MEEQQRSLVECMRDTESLHHDVAACVCVASQSAQMTANLTDSLEELVSRQREVSEQHKCELKNLDEQIKANALINQNLETEIATHKRRRLQSPQAPSRKSIEVRFVTVGG